MVRLDHNIDPEILKNAWNRTKQVYPLIDLIPERRDNTIVFCKDETVNDPVLSRVPLTPGTKASAHRAFSLTYFADTVTMNAYHCIVDGGGINMIFSTLMYFYLEEYTGQGDEQPPVITTEGRKPEEYFIPLSSVDVGEFEQQPFVSYTRRKGMFIDLDMCPDEEGNIRIARIKAPVDQFIQKSKAIGANPSAMLAILMAKAAYTLHPEKKGDLAFVLTMSARNAFHIPASIANCSANLLIPVSYEEIMKDEISKAAGRIRAVIDYQRQVDYLKTLTKFYDTYDWIQAKRYAFLTYIGKLDVGANTKHIKGFEMTDDATDSIYMMELNGEFDISFQCGKVTEKYMNAVMKILGDFGIDVEVETAPRRIMRDVSDPVL